MTPRRRSDQLSAERIDASPAAYPLRSLCTTQEDDDENHLIFSLQSS